MTLKGSRETSYTEFPWRKCFLRVPEMFVLVLVFVVIATVVAVYSGSLPLAMALDVGMLLACLVWLFFLVKIPWDLYFAARKARIDGEESVERGISGVEEQTYQLKRMETALLWTALGGHALTAAAVLGLSAWRPELVRPSFSLLFVVSVAFRPAWEGYGYLSRRLKELATQVRYPREDINTLKTKVEQLKLEHETLGQVVDKLNSRLEARFGAHAQEMGDLRARQVSELAALEKRTVQLSYRFEEVVEKMSSDQDLLAGVRAFARMLREPA